jgi:hypothetical protein
VEIGRLHANSGIDEHLCCLDAVGLDRDAWHYGADASEHLAADLPGVVASTPGVGHLGAGESPADGIDDFAAHRIAIGWDARSYFAVAHLTSNYAAARQILPRRVGKAPDEAISHQGNGSALISGCLPLSGRGELAAAHKQADQARKIHFGSLPSRGRLFRQTRF